MTRTWRHIDPATHGSVYSILGALVAPRPIAWVATVAPDGTDNIAPHSFYQLVSTAPPVVMVSSIGEKDTVRNIRATGEFTVCGAAARLMREINDTAVEFPHGISEFDRVGLERLPGVRISCPRAAEAPYALECRLLSIESVGNGLMILGEVIHIVIDDSVFDGDRILDERLNLASRLGGSEWGHGAQLSSVPRISLDEFNARSQ